VVSNIFDFHPYLGTIPILTSIFQLGWNHQLDVSLFDVYLRLASSFFPSWPIGKPQVFACSQLLKVVEDLLSGRNKTTEIKEKLGWCWCAKNGRKCWIIRALSSHKWPKNERVSGEKISTPKRWRYRTLLINWWRGVHFADSFVANELTSSSGKKLMECHATFHFMNYSVYPRN